MPLQLLCAYVRDVILESLAMEGEKQSNQTSEMELFSGSLFVALLFMEV